MGRTLAHQFGWIIRTDAVDEMSDQDIRSEADTLEREMVR